MNKTIGLGHYSRSNSLMNYFTLNGEICKLIVLEDIAVDMSLDKLLVDDLDKKIELVILDSPCDREDIINWCRVNMIKTIGLDLSFGMPDLNILIFEHSVFNTSFKKAIGTDYIIIKDEILNNVNNNELTDDQYVLVILGGGDLNSQSTTVSKILLEQNFRVKLVLGPLAKKIDHQKDEGFEVYHDPPNLLQIMKNCSWAVTNGGNCLFELLCLGKNVVVIPQTEKESNIANYFASKKGVLGIGTEELKNIKNNYDDKARSIIKYDIDGHGRDRIYNLAKDLING